MVEASNPVLELRGGCGEGGGGTRSLCQLFLLGNRSEATKADIRSNDMTQTMTNRTTRCTDRCEYQCLRKGRGV
ncbi:hypothetical protein M378DRAFT_166199 [Amanita muscaria Koide BX008]|uniref:Uncharacterized protein n=1 Tax=Amanita muscaria (strain Koide BX008) TaxID=946122 RepID=A0A0C2SG42_AMAMK|nr:hypothetical protein M378DRAFT_166199 [Amanita muscaria Koide BX008]